MGRHKGAKVTEVAMISEVNSSLESPPIDPDLVERVVTNYVIMRQVFVNVWELDDLHNCRLVCRNWNDVARPFFLDKSKFDVLHKYRRDKRKVNLGLKKLLPYRNILIGDPQLYEGCVEVKASDLVDIINSCSHNLEYLALGAHTEHGVQANFERYPTLVLPKLRRLVIEDLLSVWTDYPNSAKSPPGFVIDLIKRAPNLRELGLRRDVGAILLPHLKSNRNFTSNLQVLRFVWSGNDTSAEIGMLRGLKLRLKTLEILYLLEPGNFNPIPEMVDWIEELRETLVNLELKTRGLLTSWYLGMPQPFILNFPSEMPVLRRLEIQAAVFGVNQVPGFLSKLPVLEMLQLSAVKPLVEAQTLDQNDEAVEVFPQVRDLIIETEYTVLRYMQGRWNPADLYYSPSMLVSKLFPNLRRLSIYISTWNELLKMIDDLKELKIEDLSIQLFSDALRGRTRRRALRPSLSKWKYLHKLSVKYEREIFLKREEQLFPKADIPTRRAFLSILAGGKTLSFLELDGFGEIPFIWIKDVVIELPELESLVVRGHWSSFIHDKKGIKLTEDEVRTKLQAALGHLWNPYLSVFKKIDGRFYPRKLS